MYIVRRRLGVSKPTQGFDHVGLGIGLAAVNYVVDSLGAAEMRMRLFTNLGRDPAHVIVVGEEASIAEVPPQQTKLPQMIGDVLAHVGDSSIGTNNHFGIF